MPRDIEGNLRARTWARDRVRRLMLACQPDAKDGLLRMVERLAGTGQPLDEAKRHRMESLLGRDLGDVRVHDSRQAADLARRAGGEALTMQSHIFGPAEKLDVLTPEGAGLMAHEITHVIQQTQPQRSTQADSRSGMLVPQISQPMHRPGNSARQASAGQTGRREWYEPGRPSHSGHGLASPRRLVHSGGAGTPHVRGGTVQMAREAEAELSEQAVRNALQTERGGTNRGWITPTQPDTAEVAEKVYHLMRRDLILERERGVALG